MMISDPRFSTFQELTPMATEFHAAHREPGVSRSMPSSATPHYLPYSRRNRNEAFNLHRFPIINENPDQRVTVLYDDEGGPPLLQMRFSALGVPLTDTPTSEPEKEWDKLRLTEPTQSTQIPLKSPPPLDEDDVLPLPNAPFAQEGKNRSSRGSASSMESSIVEIIDVPRRTFSQRLAEARLYRARTRDQIEDQESKTTSPSIERTSDSDDPTPTPGHFFSLSRLSHDPSPTQLHDHMRTDTQSISIQSISDSIQAVQELASQFPTLPSTPSMDFCLEYATPVCGEMTCTSGQFVFAIGSPSDLEVTSDMRDFVPEVSQNDAGFRSLFPHSNRHRRQPSEEDIVRTPRQEHIPRTPTSSNTTATIKQWIASSDPVSPDTGISVTGQRQQLGFGTNPFVPRPFGDTTRTSEWVDDTSDNSIVVYGPSPPHSPDNRGGFSIQSRVAGPRTMERVPTVSTTNRPSLRGRVGPHLKPIVVPRRKSNLPKAIQCSDDGIPLV